MSLRDWLRDLRQEELAEAAAQERVEIARREERARQRQLEDQSRRQTSTNMLRTARDELLPILTTVNEAYLDKKGQVGMGTGNPDDSDEGIWEGELPPIFDTLWVRLSWAKWCTRARDRSGGKHITLFLGVGGDIWMEAGNRYDKGQHLHIIDLNLKDDRRREQIEDAVYSLIADSYKCEWRYPLTFPIPALPWDP